VLPQEIDPMANRYGVLRGRPDRAQREEDPNSPHYQIRVLGPSGQRWRVPVNVMSAVSDPQNPSFSEVLYCVDDQFRHVQLDQFASLPEGYTELGRGEGLDYIRGNLFDRTRMRHLPHSGPGANDDLQDIVDMWTSRAIDDRAECFAFGTPWDPGTPRPIDRELDTDRGVHLIHMNQGSAGRFRSDNGVWKDGGLLFHFPSTQRWVGIFLAFQSQSWHTDDETGHPIEGPIPTGDGDVVIVAALINPIGEELGNEAVVLLNTTSESCSLAGWKLVDGNDAVEQLHAVELKAGEARTLVLSGSGARLPNRGGVLTLLDASGLKVHGVSYTKEQASKQGRTIVF
jgi:uncharacterized protein YukJ